MGSWKENCTSRSLISFNNPLFQRVKAVSFSFTNSKPALSNTFKEPGVEEMRRGRMGDTKAWRTFLTREGR